MSIILTPLQAFYAMRNFLEIYFKKSSSDSIGALLSCMQFLDDDITADPALWEDWIIILGGKEQITSLQAFEYIHIFLVDYYKNSSSKNVKKMLNDIQLTINNKVKNQIIWHNWIECIHKALESKK